MNVIEKLINKFCPDGVEFHKLKSVCSFQNGFAFDSKRYKEIGEPIIRITNIQNNCIDIKDIVYFSLNDYNENLRKYVIKKNDIVIAMSGATTGKIGINNTEQEFFLNQRVGKFSPFKELNNKFLFYILSTRVQECFYIATGAAQPNLSNEQINNLIIPIPPLEVQEEIVKILDNFTQLEAELEAELEARKLQYEYYRNKLLSFEGKDVEWKSLSEVCLQTENIKWQNCKNKIFQYIDLSSVNRNNNCITESKTIDSDNAPSRAQQIIKEDDVLFGTTRPTLKRYVLIDKQFHNQICSTGFCVLRANKDVLTPKFLFFILTTNKFYSYIEANQEGAGYPAISNTAVKRFNIPLPPLAEQERIVKILDKFDALVNDISVGLPAEIEARRKQYEYYRGKLLSFKEINNG